MSRGKGKKTPIMLENLEFLLDVRTPTVEILARLDVATTNALERRLYRHGRADLVAKIYANSPSGISMPALSPLGKKRAKGDHTFNLLMERARFEASRRRRHIPEDGARHIPLALTQRSVLVPLEYAA